MEGVEVSLWLDAPAALTSIQKQVSKDLTGQGHGVGGWGVSLQCGAVGVCAVHLLFTPRWLTVCLSVYAASVFAYFISCFLLLRSGDNLN